MKDTDSYMIFKSAGGSALIPVNQPAHEYVEQNYNCEVALKDITTRDLSFHRAYFAFLGMVWENLPTKFKEKVSKDHFYQWLKHLQGQYKILYTFQDGSKFIEYESISFGRMNEDRFRKYIKEQMPVIYEDVMLPLYGDHAPDIWAAVEDQFEQFLDRLS